MPGAAGRIDHLQGKQRFRIAGVLGDLPVDHGVERLLQQKLNQGVRRVVAAGGLALVALGAALRLLAGGIAVRASSAVSSSASPRNEKTVPPSEMTGVSSSRLS